MKVGDGRFGKCVMGISERILSNSNPTPLSRNSISRCAPVRRSMLEIRVRAVVASQQDTDKRRRRFVNAARRWELLEGESSKPIVRSTLSSERLSSTRSRMASKVGWTS